ncbi:dihydrofolate reductase family protein [Niabella beijingensis]|uniref:dihydrofolate reductase family protein n=1 Tax=Niabella beijingensis TaxID=2872700 RepID=UPI001CBC7856|nr:dihydrofolate reductase family protein [Niabella beijingensis]MBZ4192615.1 dihydrofolate reductase family protein [Niabella beijingensis]
MSKLKVAAFSVSLDGFGAGVKQELTVPLGIRGEELHNWIYPTKMFHKMINKDGGTGGIDHEIAEKSFENIGAWIMGRNMFGPVRGPWPDDEWKGWWGETPPYHVPVFVLTHHARAPITMKGGTTFYFVTDGIEAALEAARKAANGKDIRIGGGVSTIRQYLEAGHIDELHIAFSPVLLGSGEHLFQGIDMNALGYTQVQRVEGENATHVFIAKQNG